MSEQVEYQKKAIEKNILDAMKVHCEKYHDSKYYQRSNINENHWYCNKCRKYFV